MEGYTARDALILMRLDLTESLHEINQEISELNDTLEFSGIADALLARRPVGAGIPGDQAVARDRQQITPKLRNDLRELEEERDDLISALEHLEERLTGKRLP